MITLGLIFSLFFPIAHSEDAVSEVFNGPVAASSSQLTTEKINKVSLSRKIFIISNDNSGLGEGDFLTVLLKGNFAARALVAKSTSENEVAIKALKIYSIDLYKFLVEGQEIQIIKGDDSYFRNQLASKDQKSGDPLIKSEADLFNETAILEDSLDLTDKDKRAIKNDNVVSLNIGFIEGLNQDRGVTRYNQIAGSWAYQIEDNIFVEFTYGQHNQESFPNEDLDTSVSYTSLRFKYSFNGPLFTIIMPYVGYELINANSPGAGVQDELGTRSDAELQNELDLVDETEKKGLIFGVTALRRLVPGWFLRLDLGSDLVGFGFALEF